MTDIQITVVPDADCPGCGAGWPNRPKVGDADGTWWWRCYNAACDISYYDPDTGRTQ